MAGASSTSCYLVEIALDARGPGPVKGLGIDGVGEKVVELDVHSSQGTYAWCRRMGPKVPRARSLVESDMLEHKSLTGPRARVAFSPLSALRVRVHVHDPAYPLHVYRELTERHP